LINSSSVDTEILHTDIVKIRRCEKNKELMRVQTLIGVLQMTEHITEMPDDTVGVSNRVVREPLESLVLPDVLSRLLHTLESFS